MVSRSLFFQDAGPSGCQCQRRTAHLECCAALRRRATSAYSLTRLTMVTGRKCCNTRNGGNSRRLRWPAEDVRSQRDRRLSEISQGTRTGRQELRYCATRKGGLIGENRRIERGAGDREWLPLRTSTTTTY